MSNERIEAIRGSFNGGITLSDSNVADLLDHIDKLESALGFYADNDNWDICDRTTAGHRMIVKNDHGKTAREALNK